MNLGPWVLGTCMAILAVFGLFLAAEAEETTFYWLGLGITAFGYIVVLAVIKIGHDRIVVTDTRRSEGVRWDPAQYLKFAGHRLRPALDLLARIPLSAPGRVYDLGCGAGNITRVIAERWPEADIVGVDGSADMLAKAAREGGDLRWEQADIDAWRSDAPADLIYSNAALHWLDNHEQLFPHLMAQLAPGGVLAVQMPLSRREPSHKAMHEVLTKGGPGGTPLGDDRLRAEIGRRWVADAADYYDLLAPLSQSLDIWETTYLQELEGDDPVLEWVRGTGLRPVLEGLDDADRETFLAEYQQRLRTDYPHRQDGHTLYPFPRLFIIATA